MSFQEIVGGYPSDEAKEVRTCDNPDCGAIIYICLFLREEITNERVGDSDPT